MELRRRNTYESNTNPMASNKQLRIRRSSMESIEESRDRDRI
jgi:hypothetical protein